MSKKVIANLTQWLNDNEIIFNNNIISNQTTNYNTKEVIRSQIKVYDEGMQEFINKAMGGSYPQQQLLDRLFKGLKTTNERLLQAYTIELQTAQSELEKALKEI